jgi:hypothetical protein
MTHYVVFPTSVVFVWCLLRNVFLYFTKPYALHSLRQSFSSNVQLFVGFCATRRFFTVFNKDPPPVSITSQINPIHDLAFNVLKIHFKIILPSTPTSSDLSLYFRFLHQNALYFFSSPSAMGATFSTHLKSLI